MANKIIKFNYEPDYDFIVFAIVSAEKEFKLAWYLNATFEMDFCKANDIELSTLQGDVLLISNYVYYSEHSTLRILRNKLSNRFGETIGFLLPELKRFDYLLRIEGESMDEISEDLPEKLKSLPCIQYFEKLKIENLKSKENLLL